MNFAKNVCYSSLDITFCNGLYNGQLFFWKQVAIGYATTPLQIIIHELGHAIAASILYKNANPKITLKGYGVEEIVLMIQVPYLKQENG